MQNPWTVCSRLRARDTLVVSLIVLWGLTSFARADTPLAPALIERVPTDLRQAARRHVTLNEEQQERWITRTDEALRRSVLVELASKPAAASTVLRDLPTEPPATQLAILGSITDTQHWTESKDIDAVLLRMIASEGDAAIVLKSLETLRRLEMKRLRSVLRQRMSATKLTGNATMLDALATEDERYVSLERGTMLPGFMRASPEVFSIKPEMERVRIVGFGDFGHGSPAQRQVAAAIAQVHKERPFDFGLTFGDNFYDTGMHSPTDARWGPWWEELYTPLGIPFYASLGNHDWRHVDSPAAQILYSQRSQSWRMPAPYYTFMAGFAQFFVVDTNDFSEAQARWVTRVLSESKATWKLVVGHHPIYSADQYGEAYTADMRERLWPLIRNRVDAYFCGHHHSLEYLKPVDGVHFFIAGGGGKSVYSVNKEHPQARFAVSAYGFLAIDVDEQRLSVTFYGDQAQPLYSTSIEKSGGRQKR